MVQPYRLRVNMRIRVLLLLYTQYSEGGWGIYGEGVRGIYIYILVGEIWNKTLPRGVIRITGGGDN